MRRLMFSVAFVALGGAALATPFDGRWVWDNCD
jgi:hypothetical protein